MTEFTLELEKDEQGNVTSVSVDADDDVSVTDVTQACGLVQQAIQQETQNLSINDLELFGGDE